MQLSQKQREDAIGSLPEKKLERIYKPSPISEFFTTPNPQSGDWLREHPENGQSVPELLENPGNVPDPVRNIIYLLPLGSFPPAESPPLGVLKEYVELFYGNALTVKLLEPIDITAEHITTRINQYSRQKQMLVSDIFTVLKNKIPADAYCLLAITMTDLYPKPEWNFVFGQASIKNRYGAFSFARYNPAFYGTKMSQEGLLNTLLKRSCRVCVHEIGHMFGIRHCVYYDCVMSGSNHLDESESKPLHLCPVDLRKLHLICKFDPVERYERMLEFYKRYGDLFKDEIIWIPKMLSYIAIGDEI